MTIDNGLVKLQVRILGQVILWALMGIIGWSVFSIVGHQTKIAVLEQQQGHSQVARDKVMERIADAIETIASSK